MTPQINKQLAHFARAPKTELYAMARLLVAYGAEVRFAHDAALSLPATDVAALHGPAGGGDDLSATLVSTCLGMTGVVSPLPQETLQALDDAIGEEDGRELGAWLDVLHHRLLSLLHLGVQKSQPSTSATAALTDAFSMQLLQPTAFAQPLLPAQLRPALAAILSKPSCDGRDICWALGIVLQQWDLTTGRSWQPLTGGMVPLPQEQGRAIGQASCTLGGRCVLGDTAPSPCSRVQIILGPVGGDWLRRCAPHIEAVAQQLQAVLQAALPVAVAADVAVTIDGTTLEPWRLAVGGTAGPCALDGLGVVTFLGPAPSTVRVPWPMRRTRSYKNPHDPPCD